MSDARKTFQTLDVKPIILLIILKGNLSFVLKKCMFIFIKYLIATNVICFALVLDVIFI